MRGAGHIERRTDKDGKPVFRLRVDAGYDPVSGRRRQESKTVRGSERHARQELAKFLAEVANRVEAGTRERTVAQLGDEWLELVRPNLSPNTAMEWANSLRRYIYPHLGPIKVDDLTVRDIDRCYRQLRDHGGRDGTGISAATIAKAHAALRLALDQAIVWKWIADNPARSATVPKLTKTELTPPDADQARHLMAVAEARDPDWAMFLRLAAATGARRSELCAITWSAVDLDGGSLSIHRAVIYDDTGHRARDYTKTQASYRRIAVGATTIAALRTHRARQAERALATGTPPAKDAYLFSTRPDGSTPWHPHVVSTRFRRLCATAGITGVRFHDLRHMAATNLIAAGVDPVSVAGRLGHAKPTVTMNTYAKWVPARDQAAAELLDRALDG